MEIIIEKWEEILETVRKEHELTPISFETWLKPLKVHSVIGNELTILVPSEQMGLEYINKKYKLPIKVAVAEFTGLTYEIVFILPEQAKQSEVFASPIKNEVVINAEKGNLNPKYTFDTFVVGGNNRFAHSASLAVAESPGEAYNPLFLYGGVGLGKTHLMHSIAHFILSKNPNAKVLYVTSEFFTNEVIEAIRNGNNTAMSKFREKYRNIDVLLIDDVQFIIGKESTQEEFFHTFNDLHGAKKQIILSSDKPPKEMETLEDRLRSRFEWGLIADIQSPDYETRMAILRKKEELDGYNVDDEVIQYIATNVKSNIRELEGALNKLIAHSRLEPENKEITVKMAENILQDLIYPDKPKEITPELIIETVAEHFGFKVSDLVSQKRNSEIVVPRQIAMYLCRDMTDAPLKKIGNLLGKRDHTTIIHGADKISKDIAVNETTKNVVETIKKKINPN
ncbi:chromosomal replication initiator protein DnaA [Anaerosacchariphilus polymeriproducens]|uniref:Chromosomal replication initiator protein DnaA n=1 Tax=Anaerosacchariphilus polymeriproducens TaxID=1812858 RepID=A0A371AVD6_9FIRM|nr:chromosomal replication initiator protein DnaA [Anaerosacchariphilus polymeriproducens]RDU23544.1 chromosomal replication initiator protein DnaA [Anaerosacchariphilus polymeriproducens]